MKTKLTITDIEKNFKTIYGNDENVIDNQKKRYASLIRNYYENFNVSEKTWILSTPGRTELSGNHTDHNGGKVIAASINLDTLIMFSGEENYIKLKSDKYNETFIVDISDLEIKEEEKGTTKSIIRGILSGFKKNGFKVGGFSGYLVSDVIQGSGLSSSASVEVAIGSVINFLYNDNTVSPDVISKIGQFAENEYFGKPCGLMDQVACASGGIVTIDFKDNENPKIVNIAFDLEEFDYKLLVVDTGGTHQNLTDEYAAIPFEMKQIANYFGKVKCAELNYEEVLKSIYELRQKFSDRAILRVIHFLQENLRVEEQVNALIKKDFRKFIDLVKNSGNSSYKYLQNVYSSKNVNEQPISIALAITEKFLMDVNEGACRIHGGGFAGTIQVFIPNKYVEDYIKIIEKIFGKNSVSVLSIRQSGSFVLNF